MASKLPSAIVLLAVIASLAIFDTNANSDASFFLGAGVKEYTNDDTAVYREEGAGPETSIEEDTDTDVDVYRAEGAGLYTNVEEDTDFDPDVYREDDTGYDTGVEEDSQPSCPHNWNKVGGKCYRFYSQRKNWQDARDVCRRIGGDLPSIHSRSENNDLYKAWRKIVGRKPDSTYWLGLYYTQSKGHWLWSDGTRYTYEDWNKGEPNDYRQNEDCVHVQNKGLIRIKRRKWNDLNCFRTMSFFCAKIAS